MEDGGSLHGLGAGSRSARHLGRRRIGSGACGDGRDRSLLPRRVEGRAMRWRSGKGVPVEVAQGKAHACGVREPLGREDALFVVDAGRADEDRADRQPGVLGLRQAARDSGADDEIRRFLQEGGRGGRRGVRATDAGDNDAERTGGRRDRLRLGVHGGDDEHPRRAGSGHQSSRRTQMLRYRTGLP